MKLNSLPKSQSTKKKRRVGRGNSSGAGTYCGRGCKGMGQRKSGNVRPGFEGGQTPLLKRIPKLKGFKNPNKVEFQSVNLKDLEKLQGTTVNIESLYNSRIIRKMDVPVKILSVGDLSKKLTFEPTLKFSKAAKEKIEKSGSKIG